MRHSYLCSRCLALTCWTSQALPPLALSGSSTRASVTEAVSKTERIAPRHAALTRVLPAASILLSRSFTNEPYVDHNTSSDVSVSILVREVRMTDLVGATWARSNWSLGVPLVALVRISRSLIDVIAHGFQLISSPVSFPGLASPLHASGRKGQVVNKTAVL